MILLIDGYNILKQIYEGRNVGDKERAAFLSLLSKYGRRKQHAVVVVFDGGPYQWTHKERLGNVSIVYSGVRETADDYIKHYIQTHETKDVLLVSADNELVQWASRYHKPSIVPLDFYALMHDALDETGEGKILPVDGQVVKTTEQKSGELDELMKRASSRVHVKKEDNGHPAQDRLSKRKTMSKKDRLLAQKLKKL
jgi:hypothetical protein